MTERCERREARDARRIGIVSDSHGAIDPRIVQLLEPCDVVIHAGDVGGPDILAALNAPVVVAVRGNNDTRQRWGGAAVPLPESVLIDVRGGELAIVHGHQFPQAKRRHARLRALPRRPYYRLRAQSSSLYRRHANAVGNQPGRMWQGAYIRWRVGSNAGVAATPMGRH